MLSPIIAPVHELFNYQLSADSWIKHSGLPSFSTQLFAKNLSFQSCQGYIVRNYILTHTLMCCILTYTHMCVY